MSVNEASHIKRMQAIHADQQDVVDIGRLGARAKCHAGQQAECDLFQYHKIFSTFFVTAPRDCGSRIFHADDGAVGAWLLLKGACLSVRSRRSANTCHLSTALIARGGALRYSPRSIVSCRG